MNMFNTISAELLKTFSLQATGLGLFSAFYFYGNLIFLLPAGVLYDKCSPRKLLISMMLLSIISTMVFSLSPYLWLSVLCRAIAGVCNAFSFVGCLRVVSDWFQAKQSALVIGVMVTLGLLGGMVAQTPLAELMQAFGWRHALLFCCFIALILWLVVLRNVKDSAKSTVVTNKRSSWSAYFNPQNYLCGMFTAFLNVPVSVLGALWNNLYLTQVVGFSLIQASMITSMLFLGVMIGSPLIGWLSDGTRKRKPFMVLGVIVSAVMIGLIIHLNQAPISMYFLCYFILGFVCSAQTLGYPLLAANNTPITMSRAYSIMALVIIVTGSVVQPLVGYLLNSHWSGTIRDGLVFYSRADYHYALMLIPVAFLISFICIFLIKE